MIREVCDVVVIGLGALGSATSWHLARRGFDVIGLDRYVLGHTRGASHGSSRILRHSYHTPEYVRLTLDAYADWADLEQESGHSLVSKVGGLDLFPPDAAIDPADYEKSLSAVGIDFEMLVPDDLRTSWPQLRVPEGTVALHQPDAAIVPAGRGTGVMQVEAWRQGAQLRESTLVIGLRDHGDHVSVGTDAGVIDAGAVVIATDAWTNDVLRHLDLQLPLVTTLEQVTYFEPERPDDFAPERLPLWIWMDDPSYYGFPMYGEQTIKAAQDCGGPVIDPNNRGYDGDHHPIEPAMLSRLERHMATMLPGSGPAVRSMRCQYTLTPDRDFVLSSVPGAERVVVGLAAAHGFKFAPTFGRLLADLAVEQTTTTDLRSFRIDRPALTDPDYTPHWLV